VSRIWRALREAESYKARSTPRASTTRSSIYEIRSREAADRRSSKRTIQTILLLVYGSDEDKQPFHEESETLDIAENGCSFLIEAPVSAGQRLFLANTVNQAELQARVVHVGRRSRGKARIGVEFLRAAPEFWFCE
jgi:PilZ domain